MTKRRFRERFWARCRIISGADCWEWQRARHDRDRYGLVTRNGKTLRAHRVAWELVRGTIPDGKMVCHSCDNPPCCNPSHMFLGTRKNNMEDAEKKLRHAFGSRHGMAILDENKVYEFRKRFAAGVTLAVLAAEVSMSEKCVDAAIKGRTWKRVPFPPSRNFSRRDGKVPM